MRFSSIEFIVFLVSLSTVYHATSGRASRWLLLGASAFFYGCFLQPWWIAALLATIAVTWASGLAIQRSQRPEGKWLFLRLGVSFSLLLLCTLKYRGLAVQAADLLLPRLRWHAPIPVPAPLLFLGMSYYVFQSISYLADVYFGTIQAETSLAWVALYLSFFPKIVQGPIERAGALLPQLKAPYRWDPALARRGAVLVCWGLFKKVVVAERLAMVVDPLFKNLATQGAPVLLAGAWVFCLQLFCDFSGYTDMALGAAALFGVALTDNFNEPYLSRSMKDFWRRWHITLSTFILDYVFEPLQMAFRYGGLAGLAAALFLSFFLMGLWHGATPAYVVFGLSQGALMAGSVLYRPWQKKLHKRTGWDKARWLPYWQVFFTLNLLVLSFVLFRAGTLDNAAVFYRGLGAGWNRWDFSAFLEPLRGGPDGWVLGLALAAAAWAEHARRAGDLGALPAWIRWTGYLTLVACVLLFGHLYTQKQFIYAQF